MAAWGYRANHFTVNINRLKDFDTIQQVQGIRVLIVNRQLSSVSRMASGMSKRMMNGPTVPGGMKARARFT